MSVDEGRVEDRAIELLDVVNSGDGFVALSMDGATKPITWNGSWLCDVGDGWQPDFLLCGLGAVSLLALRHRDGARACWFLDRSFAVIAHAFDALSPAFQTAARDAAAGPLAEALDFVLRGTGLPDSFPLALLDLDPAMLEQLRLAPEPASPSPPVRLSEQPFGAVLGEPNIDGAMVRLSRRALGSLTHSIVRDLAPQAATGGRLTLPSPVDGAPVSTDICLALSHFVFGYRFVDQRHKLPFVVVATMHVCQTVAVWFPVSGTCYVRDAATGAFLLQHHPAQPIAACIRQHARQFLSPLVRYLLRPSRRIAFLFLHKHLGHHLWQDLSGVASVVADVPAASMPEIVMLNADASEMFGRIDRLYPSLHGRVDRRFAAIADLCAHVYDDGLCLLSPTGCLVTEDLAGRIVGLAETHESTAQDRETLRSLRAGGVPIVLVGLRVENRTVVDFPGFALALVGLLREETGDRVAIVVDGHNSSGQGSFESHGQHAMTADPTAIEHAIAAAIEAAIAGSTVVMVDTIGARMERSIFWSRHADFFVTPWGAGLAKYRWIGNRPGLVLAGRAYQGAVSDLGIYSDPAYREAPVPQIVLDARHVEDRPDDAGVIPIDDPLRVNYTVDLEAIREQLRLLLTGAGPSS